MKTNISFKPLLAPNEQPDLNTLKFPVLASTKLDGIRCIFKNGRMLSRSLKPIRNKQLQKLFDTMKAMTRDDELDIIVDGELYCHGMTFQEITSIVMSEDKAIPDGFKYHVFDALYDSNTLSFKGRYDERSYLITNYLRYCHMDLIENNISLVEQVEINNLTELEQFFNNCRKEGYEGVMIRNPESRYKFGRATLKENIIYKMKPYVTIDGVIKGVEQATEVREGAEKKTNELGRSVTSKKKDDRILIPKASGFVVDYNGFDTTVTLAMTDKEKEDIWKNREQYLGRVIEYKYLECGMKDKPRHAIMLRFRDDKDE